MTFFENFYSQRPGTIIKIRCSIQRSEAGKKKQGRIHVRVDRGSNEKANQAFWRER